MDIVTREYSKVCDYSEEYLRVLFDKRMKWKWMKI